MIISNQVEHLRSLYRELNYFEVIHFGTITLPISLEEKRYDEALICYEYLASAYYETGKYEKFLVVMNDYEKLCLTYGKDENKMYFYYLYSLLQVVVKNFDESIDATKKSIKYAHYLNSYELISINYYNFAAQLVHINQFEKARIAISLAEFYKNKIPIQDLTIAKGYIGALYYFATIADNEGYQNVKQEFVELLKNKHSLYNAKILFAEAILAFNMGQKEKSTLLFEQAYVEFKNQQNIMFLITVDYHIKTFKLYDTFQYTNELREIIENSNRKPLDANNVKSLLSDLFIDEDVSALSIKYPKVISKELIVQHVEQAIQNNESLYCIHWCFITTEIESLFGDKFVEHLLFTMFETIYHFIFKHNAEVNVLSKNEGEAFIKDISEPKFFELLMELEEKLQSSVVHSTLGMMEIPVHFGFIHSNQLPKDQATYEQLAAYADANLYYAKSHGQLYIYN
ncbi:hypothetical protein H9635_10400 [Solibacillus sp. A46]|uniref:GGDEF domain-containing protein n=1 Tax=Solibacillus faecavium TaxID=2762221 RepID=A0ABR8XYY4_9BACL|nr:hypothetical protein [Solibacillus faecavium]MBD8037157.1 hypothetical protein [Solibacillus faecavium]